MKKRGGGGGRVINNFVARTNKVAVLYRTTLVMRVLTCGKFLFNRAQKYRKD